MSNQYKPGDQIEICSNTTLSRYKGAKGTICKLYPYTGGERYIVRWANSKFKLDLELAGVCTIRPHHIKLI